jgi:E3 ubiquitin-protein ligase HECTD2
LSLEHTKRLVRQCLRSYLARRLRSKSLSENQQLPHSFDRQEDYLWGPSNGKAVEADASIPIRAQGSHGVGSPHPFEESPSSYLSPERPFANPPRSYLTSHDERPRLSFTLPEGEGKQRRQNSSSGSDEDPKRIFKQLEDYIIECFGSFECINHSFSVPQSRPLPRPRNGSITRKPVPVREPAPQRLREMPRVETCASTGVPDVDPRLFLLGDVAENGTWWTGGSQSSGPPPKSATTPTEPTSASPTLTKPSPINWRDVEDWYTSVVSSADGWFGLYEEMGQDPDFVRHTERELEHVEQDLLHAQEHLQRVLLKATEMLLKRPGRPISDPGDLRFLPILMENPLLHTNPKFFRGLLQAERLRNPHRREPSRQNGLPGSGVLSGQHSGIIKRIVGLLSNSSIECHNQFISWAAGYSPARFSQIKDLFSGFLTYRMLRQNEKKQKGGPVDITAGLIPQIQTGRSGAYLYEEIGTSSSAKKPKEQTKKSSYMDDWQVKAACRVLSLMFAANSHSTRKAEGTVDKSQTNHSGHILPTSDFYSSMIDNIDLVADFEAWESKRNCFSFCQYPFLLSIWAKTKVLEHDAQRQMQMKARDAWFDGIMNQRKTAQLLTLTVRRDCLVEDSLTAVSGVIGGDAEDVKKRLRIEFRGEEGIDAGGLRKEWFLLLIREVFNPDHGMWRIIRFI